MAVDHRSRLTNVSNATSVTVFRRDSKGGVINFKHFTRVGIEVLTRTDWVDSVFRFSLAGCPSSRDRSHAWKSRVIDRRGSVRRLVLQRKGRGGRRSRKKMRKTSADDCPTGGTDHTSELNKKRERRKLTRLRRPAGDERTSYKRAVSAAAMCVRRSRGG